MSATGRSIADHDLKSKSGVEGENKSKHGDYPRSDWESYSTVSAIMPDHSFCGLQWLGGIARQRD